MNNPLNVRNAITSLDAMAFSFISYPKVPGSIFISCTSFTFPAAELSLVDTELIDNTDNASVHTIITLAIIFSFSLSLTLRYQKFYVE